MIRALCVYSLLLFPALAPADGASSPISEVSVRVNGERPGQFDVLSPKDVVIAHGARLFLATESDPRAWAELVESSEHSARFRVASPSALASQVGPLRGWVVPPDLMANLLERWPTDAPFQAEVDSLGPGGQTTWIRAGANQGVAVGDSWWLRVGGQPAARCDVRFVGPDDCFCAVVPLASDPFLRAGARVALWPAPGQRRTQRATSAVSYIEERGGGWIVWVASPPGVVCPAEPHVDFFRDGQYIGHGLAERRDGRFWYVRFVPVVTTPPGPEPTTGGDTPASQPRAVSSPARPRLRVGDDVQIRTQADIDARRFAARVFELAPSGALVNAGEVEGLAVGQKIAVYRDGRPLGRVAVSDVQGSYAVVGPSGESAESRPELRVGDELRFDELPVAPVIVGSLARIVDESLITARIISGSPPLVTPLAVRSGGQTVAVALLVTASDGTAVGFIVPGSLIRPLAAGMQLLRETEP